MKKWITGIIAAFAMLPIAAFAATDITHLVLNGAANATVDGGDSIDAEVTFDLTGDDDAESVSVEVPGTGLPKHCENISDKIQSGTYEVSFDFPAPQEEGTWDVEITVFGLNGEGTNQNCEGGGDDTMTFTNRVTVNGEDDTDSDDNSAGSSNDVMQTILTAILALLQGQSVGGSGGTSSACAALGPYAGLNIGSSGPMVTQLQSFLIGSGNAIPALTAGAPYGYFGPQTSNALWQYKMTNKCG